MVLHCVNQVRVELADYRNEPLSAVTNRFQFHLSVEHCLYTAFQLFSDCSVRRVHMRLDDSKLLYSDVSCSRFLSLSPLHPLSLSAPLLDLLMAEAMAIQADSDLTDYRVVQICLHV